MTTPNVHSLASIRGLTKHIYKSQMDGAPQFWTWKRDLTETFTTVTQGVATGNYKVLEDRSSDAYFSEIVQKYPKRLFEREATFDWKLDKFHMTIQNASVITLPAPIAKSFLQITTRLKYTHTFTAKKYDGEVISTATKDMDEIVVFERLVEDRDTKWLLLRKAAPGEMGWDKGMIDGASAMK